MTASSADAYLRPQERFEGIRRHHHRRTGGRLIDLAYPNAPEAPAGVIAALEATLRQIDGGALQYTPYGGATIPRRRVAHALRASHGAKVRVDDVVLTPGAMSALSLTLAAAVGAPGDEVAIVTPCWLDTPLYAAKRGATPILVPTRDDGRLDLCALAAAVGPRTRAVVISQPSNPCGVLYDADSLDALAEILAAQPEPPILLSDECHRDYVFGDAFVSPLARYERTAVVYSFGKRLRVQGQRLGYVAFHPSLEGWSERVRRLTRAFGHATPSALMQRALPRLIDLDVDVAPIAARRRRAVARLEACGYAPRGAHTMFVYARVPAPWDDFTFCERLASEGVLVMPSSVFHAPGGFRLAMTASDEDLEVGLDVLAALAHREAA